MKKIYKTIINILKILYQTEITKENLAHNLDLKENTIAKSIIEINNILSSLKFNKIETKGRSLKINLTKNQWKLLFNKINSLTFEERVDYLYIKFIYFNSINLEKEKKDLNISRSSINRCFLVVKKMLENNNSKVIYDNKNKNRLLDVSSADKKLFMIKVTKLIIEEDILIPIQRELLSSIKKFEIKLRMAELTSIYRCLKFPITLTLLSYLCSLEIYVDRFCKEEKLCFESFKLEGCDLSKRITIVVDYLGCNFNKIYMEYLKCYIYELNLNKHYFFDDILYKANYVVNKLMKIFKIDEVLFKNILLEYFYLGILKRENNILKVRNVKFQIEEEILLKTLNLILNEFNTDLYICDKYKIIYLLKKKIIELNMKNIKNVLILLQETNLSKQIFLKNELEENFANIKFDIEYNFFYIRNKNKYYDFIIDDSKTTFERGDIFNRIENQLELLIIEKLLLTF